MNCLNLIRLRSLIKEENIPVSGIIIVAYRWFEKIIKEYVNETEYGISAVRWRMERWTEIGLDHVVFKGRAIATWHEYHKKPLKMRCPR
jgi:hypothetical protein